MMYHYRKFLRLSNFTVEKSSIWWALKKSTFSKHKIQLLNKNVIHNIYRVLIMSITVLRAQYA